MNKKDRQRESIMKHGLALARIFGVDELPVTLSKKVHRLEAKAHRLAEDYCNVPMDEAEYSKQEESILASLDKILGYKDKGIPVLFNGDPRGYALKIDADYVKEYDIDITKDWGGYGIIAPDF